MKDLFRRKPLRGYSDYSTSHLSAGTAYAARFRERPGRAAMWELEKELIKEIFTDLAPQRTLDFATGTGRIVSELEQCLPGCDLHGIDISADMLTIARTACTRAVFHEMDGRQALDHFGKETFDAVSAFRFFPNADPVLRTDVADQISRLTKPGGHVVINNHRGFWSLPYVAMRALGNSDGNYGSRNMDIKHLFLDRGFSCLHGYSIGVWPQHDFRSFVLPWPTTLKVERFNMRHFSKVHTLGYNTIFVFKKDI